jgi:hypothetical protein
LFSHPKISFEKRQKYMITNMVERRRVLGSIMAR